MVLTFTSHKTHLRKPQIHSISLLHSIRYAVPLGQNSPIISDKNTTSIYSWKLSIFFSNKLSLHDILIKSNKDKQFLCWKLVKYQMWVSLRHCSNGFLVLNVMSCNLQANTLLKYWCPIQLGQSQSKSTKNTNMIILTTLSNPKYAVGPKGRWLIVIPSGTPRCSWTRITSVNSCARQVSIISLITCKGEKFEKIMPQA